MKLFSLPSILLMTAGALAAGNTAAQAKQKKYITVSGKVKFVPNAEAQSKYPFTLRKREGDDYKVVDTVKVAADGTYKIKVDATTPAFYNLNVYEWERLDFWANKDNLTINFRGEDTAKIKIKNPPYEIIEGSEENNFVNQVNFISYQAYQNMIAVGKVQYAAMQQKDSVMEKKVSELMNTMYSDDISTRIKLLIRMYGDKPYATFALAYLSPKRDKDIYVSTLTNLAKKYPWYKEPQQMLDNIAKAEAIEKKTAIGQPALAFTQNDVNGKPVSLASYKGKYVLIDFWASWCGPCRSENPNVVKAYEAYHDKGFEILGVSLDSKEDAWKKAINADGLMWNHVSDLKGWKNDVAVLYNIRAVPSNFLLDKDGKIIAKNLRGKELEATLKTLLDN